MGVEYTTVERCFDALPDLMQDTNLTSAHMVIFIEDAEADMNARLRSKYAVPVAGDVPLLQALSTDCSIYRVLSRRIFTQERLENSVWPDRFKECMETVTAIAKGEITLVDSAGNIIDPDTTAQSFQSTTKGSHQTFWEGGDFEQVKDRDKIEDERSRRI